MVRLWVLGDKLGGGDDSRMLEFLVLGLGS